MMQIEVSDETARDVRTLLAQQGKDNSLAEYVDQAVRRAVFFDTVREVKRDNADADPIEIDRLIDEAVQAIRTAN
jgi:hypothetical protein